MNLNEAPAHRAGVCALLAACLQVGASAGAVAALPNGEPPADVTVEPASPPSPPANVGASSPSPLLPAVFVVDSANTLRSFDRDGIPLQQMHFNTEIGHLNGGMTLAMGVIYVTWAARAGGGGGVFAFDTRTLRQVRLHLGAFNVEGGGVPGELHAIAFDPHENHFHVATERMGLLAFDSFGRYLPRTPLSTSAAIGVAYDASRHSLWTIIGHTVVRFGEEDGSALPGLPAGGALYRHGRAPRALAYCAGGEGGSAAIAVVFGDAKAGSRVAGAWQSYDAAGKPVGSPNGGTFLNPHAMSCSARGEVFIAADNGLLEYTLQGAVVSRPGGLRGLNSPIYGVLAAD